MNAKENILAENNWYKKTANEIFETLDSNEYGLTKKETEKRTREYGFNKLPEAKIDSLAVIFLRQFQSSLIYILLAAALVVFVMGETVDGIIIFAVLFFNAVVGAIQEGKAQNTLLALKKFISNSKNIIFKFTILRSCDLYEFFFLLRLVVLKNVYLQYNL